MLRWAALFFVIALIAAVLGFGGIAAASAQVAQILFYIFVVLFLASLIAGFARRGPPDLGGQPPILGSSPGRRHARAPNRFVRSSR